MYVSLPWYDLHELTSATDTLWRRIAGALRAAGVRDVPSELDRRTPYEQQWRSGELLFGQACGYDVAVAYADALQVVATPCYRLEGCLGATYRSLVVVRDDDPARTLADLRRRRCAVNTPTSHSGRNVLHAMVAPLSSGRQFFADVVVSGGHEASLALLRHGVVDVAAVDCVTYALLARVRPAALGGTRVLAKTPRAPAPPYVTSTRTDRHTLAALRAALAEALADVRVAGALHIAGLRWLARADYRPIVELERQAESLGAHELRACACAS
ncbi:MAG: PhnD/SsuA/transferrin family substrate-binding protein [Myxococcales bacterium]|nr:PhnD/SsuA/transferrin family substrate-binding protein [Myxococcales bacterium]